MIIYKYLPIFLNRCAIDLPWIANTHIHIHTRNAETDSEVTIIVLLFIYNTYIYYTTGGVYSSRTQLNYDEKCSDDQTENKETTIDTTVTISQVPRHISHTIVTRICYTRLGRIVAIVRILYIVSDEKKKSHEVLYNYLPQSQRRTLFFLFLFQYSTDRFILLLLQQPSPPSRDVGRERFSFPHLLPCSGRRRRDYATIWKITQVYTYIYICVLLYTHNITYV